MSGFLRQLERLATRWTPGFLKPVLRAGRNRVTDFRNARKYHRRLSEAPDVNVSDRDVLIVVIDCLRVDHTGLHDYDRDTTPFLNSLPVQYPHTVAAAPWTYSSVSSLLSGQYPHTHGAVPRGEYRNFDDEIPRKLDDDVHLMSELLGAAGYDTISLTSIGYADIAARGRFADRRYRHDADAATLVDELLEWWQGRDGPRFAYLHLADLHEPLAVPDDQPFGEVSEVEGLRRWNFQQTTTPTDEFERYRTERVRLYDTLVRYVDAQLRRLYEMVMDSEEPPLVVVTGDHGEEFWEHAELEREQFDDPRGYAGVGHGHSVFNEVVNVPMVVNDPTFAGVSDTEATINDWVSLVDVAPTVLDTLGGTSVSTIDGRSLKTGTACPVFSEAVGYGYEKKAAFENGHKLVVGNEEGVELLYDLSTDYAEKDPIDDLERHEVLRDRLRNIDEVASGRALDLDDESMDNLRDLGYLE